MHLHDDTTESTNHVMKSTVPHPTFAPPASHFRNSAISITERAFPLIKFDPGTPLWHA